MLEAAPMMMARSADNAGADLKDGSAVAGDGGEAAPVVLRSEFADTAFWIARIETDDQGMAKIPFKLPDNLASWKVRDLAVSTGLRVGSHATETVTRKKLMARLQMPRFLVENDRCMLSSLVNNEWDEAIDAEVELTIDGETQLQCETELSRSKRCGSSHIVRLESTGNAEPSPAGSSRSCDGRLETRFGCHGATTPHPGLRNESNGELCRYRAIEPSSLPRYRLKFQPSVRSSNPT